MDDKPGGVMCAVEKGSDMVGVRTEDLRVSLGGDEILKGITVDARRGEILAIIGPAGAGKTTFLRCINRMHDLDL